MLPKWHILFGAIASLVLYLFSSLLLWQILLFFLASFLIDTDHYLIYAIKRKEISLVKIYNAFKEIDKKQCSPNFKGKKLFFLCIFHTYEFLFLFSILTIVYKPAIFILGGFVFHLLTDITFARDRKTYLKVINLSYFIKKGKKNFGEIMI